MSSEGALDGIGNKPENARCSRVRSPSVSQLETRHLRPKSSNGPGKSRSPCQGSCASGHGISSFACSAVKSILSRSIGLWMTAGCSPPSTLSDSQHRPSMVTIMDPVRSGARLENILGLRLRQWNMKLLAPVSSTRKAFRTASGYSGGRGDRDATPRNVAGITGSGGARCGPGGKHDVVQDLRISGDKHNAGRPARAEGASPEFPAKGARASAAAPAPTRWSKPGCRSPAGRPGSPSSASILAASAGNHSFSRRTM